MWLFGSLFNVGTVVCNGKKKQHAISEWRILRDQFYRAKIKTYEECSNPNPRELYQSECVGSRESESVHFKLTLNSHSTVSDLCFVYCWNCAGCFPATVDSLGATIQDFSALTVSLKIPTVAVTDVAGTIFAIIQNWSLEKQTTEITVELSIKCKEDIFMENILMWCFLTCSLALTVAITSDSLPLLCTDVKTKNTLFTWLVNVSLWETVGAFALVARSQMSVLSQSTVSAGGERTLPAVVNTCGSLS